MWKDKTMDKIVIAVKLVDNGAGPGEGIPYSTRLVAFSSWKAADDFVTAQPGYGCGDWTIHELNVFEQTDVTRWTHLNVLSGF
jgi:hypothetical protein